MEYVADELRRHRPAAARPAARALAARGRRSDHGAARPDPRPAPRRPAHAHRESGRDGTDRGRCSPGRRRPPRRRPHLPRPRPQRLLQPESRAGLPARRAAARAAPPTLWSRSATRCATTSSRSASRRRAASRRPVRVRPPGAGVRPTTRREAAFAAELGVGEETFVVGWAGRLTAIKRPLDLVRTLRRTRRPGRRRGARRSSETAKSGRTEALARRTRRRRTVPASSASSSGCGTGTPRSTPSLLTSAERGNPGRRDRGAGRRASGRRNRAGGTRNRRRRRRERLPGADRRHRRARSAGSPRSLRDPALRSRASAGTAPPTFARASRLARMTDERRRGLPRGARAMKVAPRPQDHGHQRLREPPAGAASRAPRAAASTRGSLGARRARLGRAAVLRTTRRAGRPVPASPLQLDVSPRMARDVIRAVEPERPTSFTRTSSTATSTARPRRRAPRAVRLLAPQRRPLPARARSATSTARSRGPRAG